MNILVTGAAGFIGSNFVKIFINKYPDYNIIVLDKLTYAGKMENLYDVIDKITFIKGDICDEKVVNDIFVKYKINGVINFAAETHVDNSIENPIIFTKTNILGTHNLLEVARKNWKNEKNKFVQISTDEVYGQLGEEGYFTEQSPINPSSPYSASKAGAEEICLAYHKTYGMNINITNCSNNYGPNQCDEKLIPHMIKLAINGEKLPVYGNGMNIRDWLYVDDHCEAIDLVFHKGRAGERYNIGGNNEKRNIEIVKIILKELNKSDDLISYVPDRKGHDYRYAIDANKIRKELGFNPKTEFNDGIKLTIQSYLKK